MKKSTLLACAAFIALLSFSGTAFAEYAITSTNANLRAGPGKEYPVIAQVGPDTEVNIYGCLSGWGWCDVDAQGIRGWITGKHLEADYDNRREYIYEAGPYLGLPFLAFNQDAYWGTYYSDRPFYRDYYRQRHGRFPTSNFERPDFDHKDSNRHDFDRGNFDQRNDRPQQTPQTNPAPVVTPNNNPPARVLHGRGPEHHTMNNNHRAGFNPHQSPHMTAQPQHAPAPAAAPQAAPAPNAHGPDGDDHRGR